jgi:hypothetical protein
MIVIGNKRIVDVVVSGTYITKGIFIDDRLNRSVIFQKETTFIAPTQLNTGDAGVYSIIINNVVYSDIIITSDSNNIVIQDNKVTFNKAGEYNLTLRYKTIEKTITVNVEDINVSIK